MQDDRKYCVYRHTSPNGKVYIGITHQKPKRRWCHGHGYRHNPYFLNAIQKYGWNAFVHEILFDELSRDEACKKEIELIREHRSDDANYGYNLSSGGEFPTSGCKLSPETRQRLSECKLGEKNYWYGKTFSEDHKRKLSEAHKGYKPTPEECRQRSERQMGEKNHNYGKRASEETRAKMSRAHRKYTVVQMTLDGEVVNTYHSTAEASKMLGCAKETIGAACRGKTPTALGYKWKYIDFKEE